MFSPSFFPLIVLALASGHSIAVPARITPKRAATSLDAGLKGDGKVFWGAAADSNTLSIPANAAVLQSDFGGVTPENSMKWDSTEASQGSFSFAGSDALVDWATTNGKQIRGHTLVWHSQLPSWVSSINDAATLAATVVNYTPYVIITEGMKASIIDYSPSTSGMSSSPSVPYILRLSLIDFSSEMFNEDGTIRSSVFSNILGESFVSIAFQAARDADRAAKLYINDYNLDSNNAKVQGLVNLVQRVNANAKLIDGIGTQMHLGAGGAGGVQAALTALAAAGTDVAITELDIAGAAVTDYTTVVTACLNTPACVSITSWGVSDANSWRSVDSPLLFDGNYQPKAAYDAILNML
ncbi:hypothetical protein ONZ45_g2470 [Pleurotus djamor]|nr:hypothetical protein ONZ45_g2470 [Pleurotus djamor]